MQERIRKIAICDDEKLYRVQLCDMVHICEKEMQIQVIMDVYDSAKSLMERVKNRERTYDLLFLDVEMPEMTGIEVAEKLRKIDPWVCISFVTSHEAFAIQAFDLDAIGYVVKPINYMQIRHIMEKTEIQIKYRQHAQKAEKKYIKIKSGYEEMLIHLDRVLYIEKCRNQCIFHLKDREIRCYETLKNIYDRVKQENFMYTHQGYIVNFNHVKEVRKDAVCFGENRTAPLSRSYRDRIKELHLDKIRRLYKEQKGAGE